MFFIPLGMMRGADISIADFLLKNLLPVTLGNIVGGAVCIAAAYAATYGSLLTPSTPPTPSPSSVPTFSPTASLTSSTGNNKPSAQEEGGTIVSPTVLGMRAGAILPSTEKQKFVRGTDFLPVETQERAAAGNMFEKVKIKKDGSAAWTDVHEYAAAIRSGKIKW